MQKTTFPDATSSGESVKRQAGFSPLEQRLIEKSEQAIREGIEIERWYRQAESGLKFFPLDLEMRYRLPNRAEGFFSRLSVGGATRSAMGCRQVVELGRAESSHLRDRLREFAHVEFQERAKLTSKQGRHRGFEYHRILHRHPTLGPQRVDAGAAPQPLNWTLLGQEHAWVLQRVDIHNFVARMGPMKMRMKEAAFIVAHPEFRRAVENPRPDCALEVSFGYPFVDVAPHDNMFGFGPGKFGAAVKLFSFLLSPQNDLRVRMVFIAAPRSQKVLDFGKGAPCPVYGGAKVLRYLTLGLVDPQTIHDRMDAKMLALHCQVHQDLMDNLYEVWTEWLKANP
jgi:hypothetical protein